MHIAAGHEYERRLACVVSLCCECGALAAGVGERGIWIARTGAGNNNYRIGILLPIDRRNRIHRGLINSRLHRLQPACLIAMVERQQFECSLKRWLQEKLRSRCRRYLLSKRCDMLLKFSGMYIEGDRVDLWVPRSSALSIDFNDVLQATRAYLPRMDQQLVAALLLIKHVCAARSKALVDQLP